MVYGTCAGKVVLSSMRTIFYCDTMKKSLYVMIFLALCIIVPAVDASLNVGNRPSTSQINASLTMSQTVNYGEYPSLSVFDGNTYWGCSQADYNKLHEPVTSSYTITSLWCVIGAWQNGPIVDVYRFNIIVNTEPTPEPTPEPEGAYLTATVLSESYTGTMYEIQTHSTTATILTGWFSEITTTPQTYRPMATPFEKERTLIYKVPTGETITFYSLYVNLPGVIEEAQQVSITVTGTGLNPDEIINETSPEIQPNNTAYNPPPIPQVTPGSNNNPINSGKFKPSNNNYVTPFTEFIENAKTITRLPTMTDPQVLKTEVLNGTGNITAPLYNTIDGFTNLLIFPAVTASNNIQLLLQPLEEMLQYCDAVMIEIFKTVNNFFVTIYPLRDFFYMLIPDFVWWIMAALLVFEIVVTIMTFVYGRGVTWYYLFGFGEHDKK